MAAQSLPKILCLPAVLCARLEYKELPFRLRFYVIGDPGQMLPEQCSTNVSVPNITLDRPSEETMY